MSLRNNIAIAACLALSTLACNQLPVEGEEGTESFSLAANVKKCTGPHRDCDGSPENGCETNTHNNPNHCGGCGIVCGSVANGTPGCGGGKCVIAACNPGWMDCDGNPANGCEANVGSDVNNCGACGNVCAPGATCTMGVCSTTCSMGTADCDSMPGNGCETSTTGDVNNCGACSNVCPMAANAMAACQMSMCSLTCNMGFGDCDGMAGNGCESDMMADVNNCGACGNVCAEGSVCTMGVCTSTCDSTHLDCDGNATNGCEADILADPHNCGGCGFDCGEGGVCLGGGCF